MAVCIWEVKGISASGKDVGQERIPPWVVGLNPTLVLPMVNVPTPLG